MKIAVVISGMLRNYEAALLSLHIWADFVMKYMVEKGIISIRSEIPLNLFEEMLDSQTNDLKAIFASLAEDVTIDTRI